MCVGAVFDISGTILETLNTEFVGVQADNSADDGDGCSLALGVLIDSLPPFDGGVIPGIRGEQVLGCIEVGPKGGLECDASTFLVPEDGVNGLGKVPVRNLLSVDNLPYPISARALEIVAGRGDDGSGEGTNPGVFYRGDCNFTGRSRCGLDPVEIADAAADDRVSPVRGPRVLQASSRPVSTRATRTTMVVSIWRMPSASCTTSSCRAANSRRLRARGFRMEGMGVEETGPGVDPTEDPLDCEGGLDCDFI